MKIVSFKLISSTKWFNDFCLKSGKIVQKLKNLPDTQGKISKKLKFLANPLPSIRRKIVRKKPALVSKIPTCVLRLALSTARRLALCCSSVSADAAPLLTRSRCDMGGGGGVPSTLGRPDTSGKDARARRLPPPAAPPLLGSPQYSVEIESQNTFRNNA